MNREQVTGNREKRNCLECFHCKVSRKSILIKGLCFCEKKKRISGKTVKYWQEKEVCRWFDEDMVTDIKDVCHA
jgi:hypothetical protein